MVNVCAVMVMVILMLMMVMVMVMVTLTLTMMPFLEQMLLGTPEDSTVHVDYSNFEKLMNMNGSQYFYVPNWINSPSNVTIIIDNSRKDRMGQQLSRIISVSTYAHCMQYNFCVWSSGVSDF